MPAQKRPSSPPPSDHLPSSGDSPPPPPPPPMPPTDHPQSPETETGEGREQLPLSNQPRPEPEERNDSDGEGGSPSSPCAADKDEFILVKLADIRKEVQCPICLGIIRKTRTVMECLHRFCRECIDKSMRLGNNECPACRTHCASRRSLRDDPNYDALIAAIYPDIDKYEEEDLAFHEEEKTRNRKIQESIAETLRRQSEALGRRRRTAKATAAAFIRKSQGNRGKGRSSGRDTTVNISDDDDDNDNDEEANDNDKDSSAEERSPETRPKRRRRWTTPRSSPARALTNGNTGCDETDDLEASRETPGSSPLQAGKREMLAWGKGAARSQNRHGNSSSFSGRFFKGWRFAKMAEYFRHLDEKEEYDIHVTLRPFDDQSMLNIQRPYLCCRPTLSIRQICQFIALQTLAKIEGIEILIITHQVGGSTTTTSSEIRLLGAQESIGELHASESTNQRDLVLLYRCKMES